MKAQYSIAAAAALFASLALADNGPWEGWGPFFGDLAGCADKCQDEWDRSPCHDNLTAGCLCGNATAISTINSCVGSSSCSESDKSSVYSNIASFCSAAGTPIKAGPEATAKVGTDVGLKTSYAGPVPAFITNGPFGPGGWGPFNHDGAWITGPWTSWWGSHSGFGKCPDSTWSGWTSGAWATNAPWTNWPACTCITTGTHKTIETISGTAVTSFYYDYQVAEATAVTTAGSGGSGGSSTGSAAIAKSSGGAGKSIVPVFGLGGVIAAFLGTVIAL